MTARGTILKDMLLVGSGGFLGSSCRYLVGLAVSRLLDRAGSPWGTVVVNMVGCFVIGCLGYITEQRSVLSLELKVLLIAGFLGGFTTFSSVGFETLTLMRHSQHGWAALNAVGQLVCGLLAVWLGIMVGRVVS